MSDHRLVRFREWLGVGERRWKKASDEEVQPAKTLWDWLQLLIVPVILIGVTFVWSTMQTRSDNKREDRRIAADRATTEDARQDARLQSYLDDMSNLILKGNLLDSKSGDPVRAVARIDTLTVLHRLSGERKGQVVRFLYEARLIDSETPGRGSRFAADEHASSRVSLDGADLTGADLSAASLDGANLRGADLERANLKRAHLTGANLVGADLRDAHLDGAFLKRADFSLSDVAGAWLRTDLRGAIFLRRAKHLDESVQLCGPRGLGGPGAGPEFCP